MKIIFDFSSNDTIYQAPDDRPGVGDEALSYSLSCRFPEQRHEITVLIDGKLTAGVAHVTGKPPPPLLFQKN